MRTVAVGLDRPTTLTSLFGGSGIMTENSTEGGIDRGALPMLDRDVFVEEKGLCNRWPPNSDAGMQIKEGDGRDLGALSLNARKHDCAGNWHDMAHTIVKQRDQKRW